MRKGLAFLVFALLWANVGLSQDLSEDWSKLIERPQNFQLEKENSAIGRIFGGDLDLGCSIDDIHAIIIDGGKNHNDTCWAAFKEGNPRGKVAFFPWDLDNAGAVAESLGVILIAPVSTSEMFGWKYQPKNKNADFLIIGTPSSIFSSDTERKYFSYPPDISKYAISVTVADIKGKIIGPYGPNVDFSETRKTSNLRSFVMTKLGGKLDLVKERAESVWNMFLTWQETRQIGYMLAPEGAVDSLGRRESYRGMIDTAPSRIDSALHVFQVMKMVAPVVYTIDEPSQPQELQNYPNPFNLTTTIEYELDAPSQVLLSIFNFLGQEVEKVVNEFQTSGPHQVIWNAGDAPSGIYYYRLVGAGISEIRRMTLLK